MVASWVLIAVLSSLLSQTASASETDEGTGQSKLSVNISIHEQQQWRGHIAGGVAGLRAGPHPQAAEVR